MKKNLVIILHISLWLLFAIAPNISRIYIWGFNKLPDGFYQEVILKLTIGIILFYIFYFLLIPKLLIGKKYVIFILLSLLISFAWCYLSYFLEVILDSFWGEEMLPFQNKNLIPGIISNISFIGLASLLRYSIDGVRNQQMQAKLLNENLLSELALLRTKINPHFLFNTLNNIDSMIHNNPVKASDAVIKLSGIMRYMLYESNTNRVQLSNEIEYLKNYIELQKLRIKDANSVHLSINGVPEGRKIAPMLIVPFIENAFKHGSLKNNKPAITININIKLSEIFFEIINFKKTGNEQKDKSGGVGLELIKRRLELLYPRNHGLGIYESEDQFHVKLLIRESKMSKQLAK